MIQIWRPEGGIAESARPATLGRILATHLRLIVWCKACRHQAEPDVAELVERYGAGSSISVAPTLMTAPQMQ